ncbi:PEP-CTERM sorting domain-containing protein [Planctomycetota bacterium]
MWKRSSVVWVLVAAIALCGGVAQAQGLGVTSDLVLWLKADAVTGLNDGETFHVSRTTTWADSSIGGIGDGIAQDAEVSDGGPTYRTNKINGLPIVDFGGGGAFEFSGILGMSGRDDFTAFIVGNRRGGGDQRAFQFGDTDTGTGGASVALDVSKAGFRYNDGNKLHADHPLDSLYRAAAWRMTASDTYGSPEYFRDAQLRPQTGAGNPGGITSLTDDGYIVGRGLLGNGNADNWYQGEIGEILLYDRALSDPEMAQVTSYLNEKYALTQFSVPVPGVDMGSLSNVITVAPPPSTIVEGTLESNTDGFLFVEQESLVLPQDVDVNHNAPGTNQTDHTAIDGIVAAGAMVDSFYLSYDLLGDPGSAMTSGLMEITFDWPIAGILTADGQINVTDAILGANGTTYPTGNVGLEGGNDPLSLSADMKTLTISMAVSAANIDQIRILTVVPEPASLALLGCGIVGLLARRRRNR